MTISVFVQICNADADDWQDSVRHHTVCFGVFTTANEPISSFNLGSVFGYDSIFTLVSRGELSRLSALKILVS